MNMIESTVAKREEAVGLREKAATAREATLLADEVSARSKNALGASTETQLREANERLVVATVRAQNLTEAAELATVQMSHMAEHDFLTGLPNRALLTDRLTQSIALAKRHGKRVALMYLDLDNFKHINDSLGHAIGDQLLQSAAKRLQACVPRQSDTVSRQGGDEFVVLLSEIDTVQEAADTADKLIKAMAKPHLISGHRLHVTLSIGISFYPDDGKDVETVVRNADTAMYQAKSSGRNNFQMFVPAMNERAVVRQSVEASLHQALEQQEFLLYYQPKVNLQTGEITGAEVLLRLKQADQNLVSPAQFVSIAEDCSLILPIGRWVLREACVQAVAWLKAGLAIRQIAINVSAVEFHSKDFLPGIHAILSETGLDPHHLEFELTESGLMRDTTQSALVLRELKGLGVQIAVDDFGTGYSSLSYLRRFPVDALKIDQSFVRDIDANPDESSIIAAIIAMGKSLGLRVVAEGIETQAQIKFLQSQQCEEGQGYFFSQPLPAEEFATLLAAGKTANFLGA